MAYIYKITNIITGKVYIGETVRSISARWKQHKSRAKDLNYKEYLYNSIRKYGIENFVIDEIEKCSNDERYERESYWIKEYNSLAPNGYNLVLSQIGLRYESIDTILQLWEEGYSIKRISETVHSSVKTISTLLKENGISEDKILQRRSNSVGKRSSKKVNQYDLHGNLLKVWNSASEAALNLGLNNASISKCCKGNILTYYGYIWQYEVDDEIEERIEILSSKAKTGKNKKTIFCKDKEGHFIKEYESASAAGREFGVSHAGIAYAARNGTMAYGYYWEYRKEGDVYEN